MEGDQKPTAGVAANVNSRVFRKRCHLIFFSLAVGYLAFVLSLAIPSFQRNLIFLHNVRLPIGVDFDTPERYGLSPHKTVNLRINSSEGVSLGSWFTFSDPYFSSTSFDSNSISDALKSYPTVLYLHGNAVTRAFHRRVAIYSTFSSRLHVNILAIDYRGFGDSTGTPTEEGTIQDATAAFDWLLSNGADPRDILVVGHSLGSAIATQTVAQLQRDRAITVRGLVLMSGFTSIDATMETFVLWGFPILAPLHYIPGAWQLALKLTRTHFFTVDHISDVESPIVIVHAKDDYEISSLHSLTLFDKLLEPLLPSPPPSFKSLSPSLSQVEFDAIRAQHEERKRLRDVIIHTSRVKGDSIVRYEFTRDRNVKAVFLETLWGGHDRMALQEGVQDVMKEVFQFGGSLMP